MNTTHIYRFISRITIGLVLSIFIGTYIDEKLNTSPLFLLVLMGYVIFGSLFILVKDANKNE